MVTELKLGENWSLREDDATGDIVIEDRINTQNLFSMPSGAGPIDFSAGGKDLRMATGSSIEDGGGTTRLQLLSGDTRITTPSSGGIEFNIVGTGAVDARFESGRFDISLQPANLRIATGSAIEDGSGVQRLNLDSDTTDLDDNTGALAFRAWNGFNHSVNVRSDTPWTVRDRNGGFAAYEYTSASSAPGNLDLRNARLNMGAGGEMNFSGDFFGWIIDDGDVGSVDRRVWRVQDVSTNTLFEFRTDGTYYHLTGTDFRLDTGQAIEDGGGGTRMTIDSGNTGIINENGNVAARFFGGFRHRIYAQSGTRATFFDAVGNFDAVQYFPSSSAPGTLELTNSILTNANEIVGGDSESKIQIRQLSIPENSIETFDPANNVGGLAVITSVANNATAIYYIDADSNSPIVNLHLGPSDFGDSQGSSAINLFYDSGSQEIKIENTSGSYTLKVNTIYMRTTTAN